MQRLIQRSMVRCLQVYQSPDEARAVESMRPWIPPARDSTVSGDDAGTGYRMDLADETSF